MTKSAIPANVSAPTIRNRVDSSAPKVISGPNVINSYKSEGTRGTGEIMRVSEMIDFLKNKASRGMKNG